MATTQRQTDEVNYFSWLPESLIHHILSFLPFKEIGRTCVLSKGWNSIWCNYPILDFSLKNKEYSRQLLDWIEKSLDQCLVQRSFIRELCLEISPKFDMNALAPKLDRWLGLALDKNLAKLVLSVSEYPISYSVPKQVLVSRTLEVLDLWWCTLEEDCFIHIELPCLKMLSLFSCRFIGDSLLQKIVQASPKMEHISIFQCYGVGVGRCLSISCTPPLKYFSSMFCDELERIEINAPSLHTFSYASTNVAHAVDITKCTNLKELELTGAIGMDLERLLSIFLSIEVLRLSTGCLSRNNKISSKSLKTLVFSLMSLGVEIDAPNLHTLEVYNVPGLFSEGDFSSWNVPKVDKFYISFPVKSFESACRAGLKGFLMELHNYGDLKLLIPYHSGIVMIENLHHVSFSCIGKLIKMPGARNVLISSKDETSFLANELLSRHSQSETTLYIFCSSPRSIKSVHEKLSNHPAIQRVFSLVQLVTIEEVGMGSDRDRKSFMTSHPTGLYQHAKIVLHKRAYDISTYLRQAFNVF